MFSRYFHKVSACAWKASGVSRVAEDLKLRASQIEGYCADVDRVRQDEWHAILQLFDDHSLMQTWAYGSDRWGEKKLSHVVLKKEGKIISATQAIIITIPFLPVGLAYVNWGPCWQLSGQPKNLHIFRHTVRMLYQIYVVERGLLLRIFPNAFENGSGELRSILEEEGFQKDPYEPPRRTVVVDLTYPLEELRQSLKKKWRHNLVLAERNSLTITSSSDGDSFRELIGLYGEMKTRKTWETIPDLKFYERVQRDVPRPFKMTCLICRHKGIPVSGAAVSRVGNAAALMVAATGNGGITLRSSYFLQWHVLRWLKGSNVNQYDLSGINHKTHPGPYQFKSGLGGKLGSEVDYVGAYQSANRPITRFLFQAVRRGREIAAGLKHSLGYLLHSQSVAS